MTAGDGRTTDEIVTALLDLPSGDCRALLEESCASDPELRARVESLLASREFYLALLDRPAAALVEPDRSAPVTMASAELACGECLGPYVIEQELGRGGMGAVYLATAPSLNRKAAIKVLQLGLSSAGVLERFEVEKRALAVLTHPNIATLYDAGLTATGLPYFAMEYVDGPPIGEYCDRRQLTIEARLQLFRAVCAAVHFAHEHLIVHRDLTSRNVLVAEDGTPKLLDFGLAKVLETPLDEAVTARAWMTTEYASPEQISGLPVTTRSDVYSVGVLLHLLLTGRLPFELADRPIRAFAEVVCTVEPAKPSVTATAGDNADERASVRGLTADCLGRRLAGDLDRIVLKALEKSPEARYASVREFAADVERHLSGLPVTARPQTLGYRTSKFVRRHRVGVGVAASVALVLVLSVFAVMVQARAARAAERVAERRFNYVRGLANSFLFEFHDAIDELEGATQARRLVVERALEYLDLLSREASDPSLTRELATSYERVGMVQGDPYTASLGDTEQALQSHRKAVTLRTQLFQLAPSPAVQRELASSHLKIGDILWVRGDWTKARQEYERSRDLYEAAQRSDASNLDLMQDLSVAYTALGDVLSEQGQMEPALSAHRQSLELRRQRAVHVKSADAERNLAIGFLKVADVQARTGALADSIQGYRRAIETLERVVATDPTNARYRSNLVGTLQRLGNVLQKDGAVDEAVAASRRAVEISTSLLAGDPSNAFAQRELASSLSGLGSALIDRRAFADAVAPLRRFRQLAEAMEKQDAQNAQTRRDLLLADWQLARAYLGTRALNEAEEFAKTALARAKQLVAADPTPTAYDDLADTHATLGRVSVERRVTLRATIELKSAVDVRRKLVTDSPDEQDYRVRLAETLADLGDAHAAEAAAAPTRAGALAAWRRAADTYAESRTTLAALGKRGEQNLQDVARRLAVAQRALVTSPQTAVGQSTR